MSSGFTEKNENEILPNQHQNFSWRSLLKISRTKPAPSWTITIPCIFVVFSLTLTFLFVQHRPSSSVTLNKSQNVYDSSIPVSSHHSVQLQQRPVPSNFNGCCSAEDVVIAVLVWKKHFETRTKSIYETWVRNALNLGMEVVFFVDSDVEFAKELFPNVKTVLVKLHRETIGELLELAPLPRSQQHSVNDVDWVLSIARTYAALEYLFEHYVLSFVEADPKVSKENFSGENTSNLNQRKKWFLKLEDDTYLHPEKLMERVICNFTDDNPFYGGNCDHFLCHSAPGYLLNWKSLELLFSGNMKDEQRNQQIPVNHSKEVEQQQQQQQIKDYQNSISSGLQSPNVGIIREDTSANVGSQTTVSTLEHCKPFKTYEDRALAQCFEAVGVRPVILSGFHLDSVDPYYMDPSLEFITFHRVPPNKMYRFERRVNALYCKKAASLHPSPTMLLRGISKDLQRLYCRNLQNFTCLDGSKKIPLSQLNDNFCDCEDSTDEPGTSACPNATFVCDDESLQIFSSFVNDGICDCCDGSDEYLSLPSLQTSSSLRCFISVKQCNPPISIVFSWKEGLLIISISFLILMVLCGKRSCILETILRQSAKDHSF